jgi:UDP:flavonoid glycosyltransferase YjiC (YdhE family)
LPMVTAGLHEGKNEICARVGYFKYGINLNTETPGSKAIQDAVEQIISNNIYRENVTRLAKEMNAYNAKELCVEYICELLDNHSRYSPKIKKPQLVY